MLPLKRASWGDTEVDTAVSCGRRGNGGTGCGATTRAPPGADGGADGGATGGASPLKVKSPVRDDASHGTWVPSVARETAMRTCLNMSSTLRPGRAMAFSSSRV